MRFQIGRVALTVEPLLCIKGGFDEIWDGDTIASSRIHVANVDDGSTRVGPFIKNLEINRIFDREVEVLTGKENTMGIIETIKKITREQGIEEGIEKGVEKGIEKGIEQKSYEIVKNLLENTDFDAPKIAALAGVSPSYVEKVKQELSN